MWDEGVNIYNYKNNLDLAQYCDWVFISKTHLNLTVLFSLM